MYMYTVLMTIVLLSIKSFILYIVNYPCTCRILLDNNTDYEVTIMGNVVCVKLELMSQPNLTPLDVLHLGSMYYGSLAKKTITLYNNSPSNTKYTTVMDTYSNGHEEVCTG